MDRVKYPPVDPKAVDHASREEQIQGFINVSEGAEGSGFFFMREDLTVSGKGIVQDAKGGFVGRAHGWER